MPMKKAASKKAAPKSLPVLSNPPIGSVVEIVLDEERTKERLPNWEEFDLETYRGIVRSSRKVKGSGTVLEVQMFHEGDMWTTRVIIENAATERGVAVSAINVLDLTEDDLKPPGSKGHVKYSAGEANDEMSEDFDDGGMLYEL